MEASRRLGLIIDVDYELELDSLEHGEVQVIETTLSPSSHIVGQSLNEARFRDQYGFTALAISSQGKVLTQRLRDIPLQLGDALLLQGPQHRIAGLLEGNDFVVLEPHEPETFRRNKAPIAVGALLLAISIALFTDFGIALAMVIAALTMILSRTITIEEAYKSVDWRTVFLVAGMLPLGLAMEATGTARFLGELMLRIFGSFGPVAALAGIYLLAACITQPMSNAAAVVLITPIALDTAAGLGANHLTFTMAVVIGAATSFLSPVGHKANVLVFGPGGYKFTDYARVGALLTVILLIVSIIFLPLVWPLFPG
jgi:di/tricarboxylate transporter